MIALLGAASESELKQLVDELCNKLSLSDTRNSPTELLRSFADRGKSMPWRIGVHADQVNELVLALKAATPTFIDLSRVKVLLGVPGMGTEFWWNIDWDRLEVSADAFDRVESLLAPIAVRDVLRSIRSVEDVRAFQRDIFTHQRLLFAVHFLLLSVLKDRCGFSQFDAVASFSAGEPSAAAIAGAFPLVAANRLNAAMAKCNAMLLGKDTTMLVVIGVPTDVAERVALAHGAEVGAFIGVGLNALTGSRESLLKAKEELAAQFPDARLLDNGLPVAFHSKFFEPLRADVAREFDEPRRCQTADGERFRRVPWYSSIRGDAVDDRDCASEDFWFSLMRAPAMSIFVMEKIVQDVTLFVELNCNCLYARTFADIRKARFPAATTSPPVAFPMLDLSEIGQSSSLSTTYVINKQLDLLPVKLFLGGATLDIKSVRAFDQQR
jgi:malonyl CoA-acyl carrier protein transacylase